MGDPLLDKSSAEIIDTEVEDHLGKFFIQIIPEPFKVHKIIQEKP